MSKFSLDVSQRQVFPFARATDPHIILGAAFGEDVALPRVGGDIPGSHVDPIVGAVGKIGWLAVHVACSDVAAAGVAPRWLLLLVLVPRLEDEELFQPRSFRSKMSEAGPIRVESRPLAVCPTRWRATVRARYCSCVTLSRPRAEHSKGGRSESQHRL